MLTDKVFFYDVKHKEIVITYWYVPSTGMS